MSRKIGKLLGLGLIVGGRVAYHAIKSPTTHKAVAHIGKMAWTHGPRVAKHTATFMVKSALKTFKLFNA